MSVYSLKVVVKPLEIEYQKLVNGVLVESILKTAVLTYFEDFTSLGAMYGSGSYFITCFNLYNYLHHTDYCLRDQITAPFFPYENLFNFDKDFNFVAFDSDRSVSYVTGYEKTTFKIVNNILYRKIERYFLEFGVGIKFKNACCNVNFNPILERL